MKKTLVEILVQKYGLPQEHVETFIADMFQNSSESEQESIEHIRELTADMLQNQVLKDLSQK